MVTVCTLLVSFDRCLMQNIKTSVDEEFNILQTDVFVFCIKHLSNNIKRLQTACVYFLQNFSHRSVEFVLRSTHMHQMSNFESPVGRTPPVISWRLKCLIQLKLEMKKMAVPVVKPSARK